MLLGAGVNTHTQTLKGARDERRVLNDIFEHAEATLVMLRSEDAVKEARAWLAQTKTLHAYVEATDPHPFKVAVATVALAVAARDLGIRTPPVTFIEPDTVAAKGRVVMWSQTAIRGSYEPRGASRVAVSFVFAWTATSTVARS